MTDISALQVTSNARGLAGLPTADGGRIASGILFRSDALSGLTADGVAAFAGLGIGTVIDLRTDGERARAADVLPVDGSVRLVPLPVQGGAMDEMVKQLLPAQGPAPTAEQLAELVERVPRLDELYLAILADSAATFAEIGRAVLTAAGTDRPGVLFHCTAGKDRTGLAAALLLALAGADRATIVADYTLTGANLAGGLAETLTALITSFGVPLTPRLKTLATESPASAIEAALDWIDTTHGSAAAYLQSGGLTPGECDALRAHLTAA